MADSGSAGADAEFSAMQSVYAALAALEQTAQQRVLDYVSNRLGLSAQARPAARAGQAGRNDPDEPEREEAADPVDASVSAKNNFDSLAELYDAAQPKAQSDKALVCGYWLQVCQGADTFDAFSVNKELKNLGQGVPNITSALDVLKGQKPALALQMKKVWKGSSGSEDLQGYGRRDQSRGGDVRWMNAV